MLLALNFTATKLLLEELEELGVFLLRLWLAGFDESITGLSDRRRKITSLLLIETASVVITVGDADLATIDSSVSADTEVIGHERSAIRLQNAVTLEESTLRHARVDLLGLSDHDRLVLKEVEDSHLPYAMVLETALYDMLFEVALETQHLLVELNVGGLKLLLNISTRGRSTKVIWVLHL